MTLITHPDGKVWIAVSVPGEAQERGRFSIWRDHDHIFQPGEVVEISEARLRNAAVGLEALVGPDEQFTLEAVCP